MPLVLFCWISVAVTCAQVNDKEYSEEFYDTFKEGPIQIIKDSLIFSPYDEVVLIPTKLDLNRVYIFKNSLGLELSIKRIHYTDIEYNILIEGLDLRGMASLSPTFHLGAESIGTKEGEFSIDEYSNKTKTSCLVSIGVGDESLTRVSKTYAYIKLSEACKFNYLTQSECFFRLQK